MTESDRGGSNRVGGRRTDERAWTDDELVDAARSARAGDHRAFTELLRRHQAHVMTNCRYLASPGDAEDLAQEVFVKAYFGLARFQSRSSFRSWIDRIKANHCLNHVRGEKTRETYTERAAEEALSDPPVVEVPDADAIADRDRVRRTLEQMSPALRVPLILADMDGFTIAQIAKMLGIGLSAVKMRLMRGRAEFRRRFDDTDAGGSK